MARGLLESNVSNSTSQSTSQARYRELVEQSHVVPWEYDLVTDRFVYVGPGVSELLGYPREAWYEQDFHQSRLHPEDRGRFYRQVQLLSAQQERFELDYRMLSNDDRVVWLRSLINVVHAQGQDPKTPPLIRGYFIDVTEHKQNEEKLRQAAAVFEHTLDAVLITDKDGKIITVNRAFEKITGYSQAEIQGKSPKMLKSGRHGDSFYQDMTRSLEENQVWQGEIWSRRKNGEIFPEWLTITVVRNDEGEISNYVSVASDITSEKAYQEKLDFLAYHDPLTSLPNRTLFNSRLDRALAQAEREHTRLAVLFLDLDRFKWINDSLGHPAGDELLRLASKRLRERLRRQDTLARLGGDEFIVLLEKIGSPSDASEAAKGLIEALAKPFTLNQEHDVQVGTSIGISLYPDDAKDATELVRNADAAMYSVKENRRGRFGFYTSHLTDLISERLETEMELRKAIDENRLTLRYQPQVDLATGQIVALYSQVFCHFPDGETKNLADLDINLGDGGLSIDIDRWAMCRACVDYQKWTEDFDAIPSISLPLSNKFLSQRQFFEQIQTLAEECSFIPRVLEFVITEDALFNVTPETQAKLDQLSETSTLVLDQFCNSACSPLLLLKNKIRKVHLGEYCVQQLETDELGTRIAKSLIRLADDLELIVIADGIETQAQFACLLQNGCQYGQGDLIHEAVSAEEIPTLLAKPVLALPYPSSHLQSA